MKIIKKFNKLINFIFPNQCPSCKKIIKNQNMLCSDCWSEVKFITTPYCHICHMPLEYTIDKSRHENLNQILCGDCLKKMPIYTKSRSVFAYNQNISKIIFGLKYYDKMHLSKFCATHLEKWIKDFDKVDYLAPVPLHKKRLLKRKYNQSALLCNELTKLSGIPSKLDLLKRTRYTKPQVELKGRERIKNIKKTIVINDKYLDKEKLGKELNNKNIVLIDDVITTGSTVKECTKVLLSLGIKNVYVLTVAKTVKNI